MSSKSSPSSVKPYLGGEWVNLAILPGSVLFNYIKPMKVTWKKRLSDKNAVKFMTHRDATEAQYPDLPFFHPDLYKVGIAPDKKIEVVAAYLLSGSVVRASEMTGVSEANIRKAIGEEWFDSVYAEMASERGAELKARCNHIIDIGMRKIERGFREGDERLTARGKIVNVAISTKDTARIVDTMMNRTIKIEDAEKRQVNSDSELRLLNKISEAFENVSKESKGKSTAKPPIDVTPEKPEKPMLDIQVNSPPSLPDVAKVLKQSLTESTATNPDPLANGNVNG